MPLTWQTPSDKNPKLLLQLQLKLKRSSSASSPVLQQQEQQDPFAMHICNDECPMMQSNLVAEVYFCRTNGAMHYCTSSACDALIRTNCTRTCLITGMSYPLDMFILDPSSIDCINIKHREPIFNPTPKRKRKRDTTNDKNNDNEDDDEEQQQQHDMEPTQPRRKKQSSTVVVVVDLKKPAKPKHPKRRIQSSSEINTPTEVASSPITTQTTTTPPHPTRRLVHKHKQSAESLSCAARKIIRMLMPSLEKKEIQNLSLFSVQLWKHIKSTTYYHQVSSRYKFSIHTVAVLYNSIDGIRLHEDYLIQPHPRLAQLLPPAKKLGSYHIKPRRYTAHCRGLQEMLHELQTM